MKSGTRKITREQFLRAMKNNGYLIEEDMMEVFTEAELCGRGVYGTRVRAISDIIDGNEYFVDFEMGASCD